jgi:hypothetical protein
VSISARVGAADQKVRNSTGSVRPWPVLCAGRPRFNCLREKPAAIALGLCRAQRLAVVGEDGLEVASDSSFVVDACGDGCFRGLQHYGFLEAPDVPLALTLSHLQRLAFGALRTY